MQESEQLKHLPNRELLNRFQEIKGTGRARLHRQYSHFEIDLQMGEKAPGDWIPDRNLFLPKEITTLMALIREVCSRRLRMPHYDVQVAAGLAMIDGNIIQMATGEGKTIVALFPAVIFGLIVQLDAEMIAEEKRRSIHIMTASDYLAQRDCQKLRPVYEFFGLSVDTNIGGIRSGDKLITYQCDIIYGTASAFGFDFLHDHVATRRGDLYQGLQYVVIIDEVDHILIDEARTALRISGEDENFSKTRLHTIRIFQPLVVDLYNMHQVLKIGADGELEISTLAARAFDYYALECMRKQEPVIKNLSLLGDLPWFLCEIALQACHLRFGLPLSIGSRLIDLDEDGNFLFLHLFGLGFIDNQLSEFGLLLEGMGRDSAIKISKFMLSQFQQRRVLVLVTGISRKQAKETLNYLLKSMIKRPQLSQKKAFDSICTILINFVHILVSRMTKDDVEDFSDGIKQFSLLARRTYMPGSFTLINKLLHEQHVNESFEPIISIGKQLSRFWLENINKAINTWLATFPEKDQKAFQTIGTLMTTLFAGGHQDPKVNRLLGDFFNKMGSFFISPHFYQYSHANNNLSMLPLGNALVRGYLREILENDLWPGQKVEEDETLDEAVERLFPEASYLITTGLQAFLFQQKDVDYIVEGNQVILLNHFTGHSMESRRLRGWTHLFLEIKEGVPTQEPTKTVAQVSIQCFVKRYQAILGMSATAERSREEFLDIYGTDVVRIEPNRNCLHLLSTKKKISLKENWPQTFFLGSQSEMEQVMKKFLKEYQMNGEAFVIGKEQDLVQKLRVMLKAVEPDLKTWVKQEPNHTHLEDLIYAQEDEKFEMAADLVAKYHQRGAPVLIEAPSILVANQFMAKFEEKYDEIRVVRLDARKEHAESEALVVAEAGQINQVTLATQMAGRGVDITLRRDAVERGGLIVISLERRESRRLDEQAAGRCARQGDPGFSVFFLSMEDELLDKLMSNIKIKNQLTKGDGAWGSYQALNGDSSH